MHSHNPDRSAGTRLAIALGAPLQVDAPRVNGRFRAELAGMLPDVCLILTHPPVLYSTGDSITVRYLHQGTVYGFRTDVRTVVTHPVKLLIVGYPRDVQEQNLRQSPRLECTLPCRIAGAAGEAQTGLLRDISRDGCQVLLTRDETMSFEVDQGASVTLSFWIPPHERLVEVTGDVRRFACDGRNIQLGIAFEVPAEEAYETVRALLDPIGPS